MLIKITGKAETRPLKSASRTVQSVSTTSGVDNTNPNRLKLPPRSVMSARNGELVRFEDTIKGISYSITEKEIDFWGIRKYLKPEVDWSSIKPENKGEFVEFLIEEVKEAKKSGGRERRVILNLESANLSGADLSSVDLSGADLSGADLRFANLRDAKLKDADLTGAKLEKADLRFADLRFADLRFADLSKVNLSDANLKEVALTGAVLTNAILTNAILEKADLTGANLSGANLTNAILWNAKLEKADLTGAVLTNAILTNAKLEKADLTGAKLEKANLQWAKLEKANLRDVDLSKADLTGAELEKADLRGANLTGANLSMIDLEGVNLTQTILTDVFRDMTDITGITTFRTIEFLQKVLEVEEKYATYKLVFSEFKAEKLEFMCSHLLTQLVEEENPANNTLSILEELYTPTNSPDPKDKVYPELAKALSNIKTPDIICWLIREIQNPDKQSRNLSIYALDFLSLLPKDTRITYWNLLKNADNGQKQNIYSLLNEFSILVQNNRKLANKYLDSNGEFIRNEINKIIQSQSDSAEFLVQTIISNTPKPITNQIIEQYKKLNTLLNLNIPENNPKFITAINAQLHKNSQNLDTDKLKTFIKENDFKPTDNQRMDLFKKNINSIIQSSYMSAISESIESFDFITPEKTKTIVENISKNPSNLKRLMTFLGYMRHSQEENSGVIKEIYPIFEQYLTDINFPNLSKNQKAEIDKQLLKNFDKRFTETSGYSWSKKMKELHPKFKANSIRGNFETKIGEYTFKAVSGTDAIFNGENVTSSQCTSVPGQSNGHLQMGLVGTSNVVWMEVRDNQGEMVSGFDIRILLDGGLVLGPAYKYNNKASIQENDRRILANEYLKHIGIASKIQLPKEIKTADPNTSKVGDVKSYHESGEVYY